MLLNRLNALSESGNISDIVLQNRRIEIMETKLRRIDAGFRSSALESGLIEWNRALLEAQLETSKQLRDAAHFRLESLEAIESSLTIRAPFNGRLINWYPSQTGETFAKGAPMGTIVSREQANSIKAYLPERNIDLAKVGQSVRIISGVYRHISEGYVWGRLASIHPSSTTENTPQNADGSFYEVEIDILDSPRPLPHGSTVQVEVIVGQRNLLEMLFLRRARYNEQLDTPAKSSENSF
jgi:multidrug resistance efflux pump